MIIIDNIDKRKWCVYIHTNKINNKIYIGQTCTSLQRRWGKNGEGYKKCPHFWRAIQKYGWDNFEHIVFAENLTQEEADRMEILLIALYDSTNKNYGYNITKGGDGCAMVGENNPFYGKHHTDEVKDKIRQCRIGTKASDETKNKLSELRRGESNSFYGKHHTKETKQKLSDLRKGKPLSKEHIEAIRNGYVLTNNRDVVQLSKDNIFIAEYVSACNAERETSVAQSSITRCCQGKLKSAGGFVWKYKEDWDKENAL